MLRAVLWKSEQRRQGLRLPRQTHGQRPAGLRGLPGRQGKRLLSLLSHFGVLVKSVRAALTGGVRPVPTHPAAAAAGAGAGATGSGSGGVFSHTNQ